MINKRLIAHLFTVGMTVLLPLYGCKSDRTKRAADTPSVKSPKNELVRTFYNIPSPSEQLNMLKDLDGASVSEKLLSTNDFYKFNTSDKRYLVFGMYAADAAYLVSKSNSSRIVGYLSVMQKLSKDLGIYDQIKGDLFREENNNPPADSLFKMADEYYLRTFDHLIANNKGAELSLLLFGGWVETMYLSLESVTKPEKHPKTMEYIVDQKLIAENLMFFMLDYQSDPSVATAIEELSVFLDYYGKLDCEIEENEVKKDGNQIQLSGGEKCQFSSPLYTDFRSALIKLRQSFIQ